MLLGWLHRPPRLRAKRKRNTSNDFEALAELVDIGKRVGDGPSVKSAVDLAAGRPKPAEGRRTPDQIRGQTRSE